MFTIFKFIKLAFLTYLLLISQTFASDTNENFETWLSSYKNFALKKGISQNTIDITFKNVKFLEKVITYDRRQPEFYEDTNTYVNKRASNSRAKKATKLLNKNKSLLYLLYIIEKIKKLLLTKEIK